MIVDGNPERSGLEETLRRLGAWAVRRNARLALTGPMRAFAPAGVPFPGFYFENPEELAEEEARTGLRPSLLVSLGGDGSLLHALWRYRAYDAPMMGVNLGSLGFNALVTPEGLEETLDAWLAGEAPVREHMLIEAEWSRDGGVLDRELALNEVSIQRTLSSKILEIDLYQGDARVMTCHADGIIVATPTGSTAYNLAAGGPIVHPALRAFIVSPLAAHNLTSRTILLPTAPSLRLEWRPRQANGEAAVLLDGHQHWTAGEGTTIVLREPERRLKLVVPPGSDYFRTLRDKLGWSRPVRKAGGLE